LYGGSARRKAYLHIEQHEDGNIQTSMSSVGFDPTTPMFERSKTVQVLDRAATVIGSKLRGLMRERTTPTELPPLVGEVTDTFCG
jgi:hypothetical protein